MSVSDNRKFCLSRHLCFAQFWKKHRCILYASFMYPLWCLDAFYNRKLVRQWRQHDNKSLPSFRFGHSQCLYTSPLVYFMRSQWINAMAVSEIGTTKSSCGITGLSGCSWRKSLHRRNPGIWGTMGCSECQSFCSGLFQCLHSEVDNHPATCPKPSHGSKAE